MAAIIQLVKSLKLHDSSLESALLVFFLEPPQALDTFVHKLRRLKLWSGWKETMVDRNAGLCFVVRSGWEVVNVALHGLVAVYGKDEVSYTNDGPCTILL